MMRLRQRILRRFTKSTDGVAALEFAMCAPVLVVMFLATFDGGRGLAAYMKVRATTYALAAISNQYPTIGDSDMSGIFATTQNVMAPYPTTTLGQTVSGITIDGTGKATVTWSSTQGGVARGVGNTINLPANLDIPNSFLIFSEVTYKYVPMFGLFDKGASINLSDNLFAAPRSTPTIPRTSP
jgi:Flp pilus assembly protein TadG